MPLSTETEITDDQGRITIEFPDDLKGNENGEITIVGKVSDHDQFGNLLFWKTIKWGKPLSEDDIFNKRELWSVSSNSPYALSLSVIIMLIGIWGTIFYIIYLINRINKAGKTVDS